MSRDRGLIAIDAIIFDYGEVIALSDTEDWARMVQTANVAGPVFEEAYWRYRLDYDAGMSVEEYWTKVAHDTGAEFTAEQIADLNRADARHWTHLDPAMLAWIEELRRAGKRIGMLSNMPTGIAPVIRDLSFTASFDALIFSCDLGVVKPHPDVYLAALRALDAKPQRTLFLDDKLANVQGAQALGIHGITFDSLAGSAPKLADYDLPQPEEVSSEMS